MKLAAVPVNSSVTQLGMTFKRTIFNENAACHIALGQAYMELF